MRTVSIFEASEKPGSTRCKARKVRIISPEPTSRTSARATCTVTRTPRIRCRSRLPVRERPPPRSPAATWGRAYWKTGIRPKSTPAASDIPSVKAITGRSIAISWMRGSRAISDATSARRPA